jgi:chitinase
MGTDSVFGKTDASIRRALKKAYHSGGVRILVSAFGATQMPTNKNPETIAEQLGKFVNDYELDGCDIDYEDNDAMEAGKGEDWLIKFTTKLRSIIPDKIITHAPQGPYFKDDYYPKGGYVTVHKAVGDMIDFYNVQFYNQGNTQYNSYNELFISSSGFFSGTAVKQIIAKGVPSNKIVVGKPAAQADVMNTGYVSPSNLGTWTTRAFNELGWYAGVMFWQLRSDTNGTLMRAASNGLVTACRKAGIGETAPGTGNPNPGEGESEESEVVVEPPIEEPETET